MDDISEEENSKPVVAPPSQKPPAEEEKKEGQKDDSLTASLSRFLNTVKELLANFMNYIKNLISSLVDMMRGPKGEDSKIQEQGSDEDEVEMGPNEEDSEEEDEDSEEEDEASKGFLSELWAKISEAFSQVMKFISGIIKSLTEMVFGKGAGNEEEEDSEMEMADTAESKPEAPAASGEEGVSKSSKGVISEVLSAIWKVLSDFIRSIKELVFGKGSKKEETQGIDMSMSSLGKTDSQAVINTDPRAGSGHDLSGAAPKVAPSGTPKQ